MGAKREERQQIYGFHAVAAALERDASAVEEIWFQANRRDERLTRILERAQAAAIPVRSRDRRELDRMAGGARHQGVVARARPAPALPWPELAARLERLTTPCLLLVLDGVQDPHNLGACLRAAGAAGVDAVITPRDRSAPLNPTVRRVACGAAESVAFVPVPNLSRALGALSELGVYLVGAVADAPASVYEVDLRRSLAVVVGAEARGLRRLTRERCDELARIPMHGPVESLNVSVAAGVLLFEARRQRAATPSSPVLE